MVPKIAPVNCVVYFSVITTPVLYRGSQHSHTLLYALPRSVEHDVLVFPRMVISADDVFPSGKLKSSNIGNAILYTMSMLQNIRAYDFHFYCRHLHPFSDIEVSVARKCPRIDAVSDHDMPCA